MQVVRCLGWKHNLTMYSEGSQPVMQANNKSATPPTGMPHSAALIYAEQVRSDERRVRVSERAWTVLCWDTEVSTPAANCPKHSPSVAAMAKMFGVRLVLSSTGSGESSLDWVCVSVCAGTQRGLCSECWSRSTSSNHGQARSLTARMKG